MEDIKRTLETLYAMQRQIEEAPADMAATDMTQATDLKGTFNSRAFAKLLGMESVASLLDSFVKKHKRGAMPTRPEIMAAADVFKSLIDATPQTVNQAMTMLRRITAEQIEHVEENLRTTKEGLEECWTDMATNGQPAAGETMTVNISMPNKNISVTTDSADEIMNVLKLAGIEINAATGVDTTPTTQTWTPPTESDEPVPVVIKNEASDEEVDEKAKSPYAVGMAKAMELTGDEPPLEKDTIKKAHDIADAIMKKDDVKEEEVEENAYLQAAAAAARDGKNEFEFPAGSGKMHPVKMEKDTAQQMGESDEHNLSELRRILGLAGLDESKLANSPAGTSMDEPTEYANLPSERGTGGGKTDYGTRQSNMGGENPMAVHTMDLEESFQNAMDEYRKFVAEKIQTKK